MKFFWIILYKVISNPIVVGLFIPFLLLSQKARQSLLPHVGLFKRIKTNQERFKNDRSIVWVHVASAGEYLQAKPLIRIFQKHGYRVFVTVTSISGYNWLQREKNENLVFDFLPFDFSYNARKMLNLIQPKALVFVKTDIWPNLLIAAQKRGIPGILICAGTRNANSNLKKSFYQFLYSGFSAVFTVAIEGEKFYRDLLGATALVMSVGDSKYDIVVERKAERSIRLDSIKSDEICALFGSVWPEDLKVITTPVLSALEKNPHLKIIVASHENDHKHVHELLHIFKAYNPVLFSSLSGSEEAYTLPFRVLVVDTIGDLFFLYENSSVAYVGGGFSTGIHNILEPCSMKNTVIFGPRHQKFPEAEKLIAKNCASSVQNTREFEKIFHELLTNAKIRRQKENDCFQFISQNTGASQKMFDQIMKLMV